QLVRMLPGEVVALARVGLGVEQLPPLVGEVAPRIWSGRGHRRGLPAVVVDAAGAEHRVELRLPALRLLVVQARLEALALQRDLRGTPVDVGQLDAEAVVDRRDDVDGVLILAADARRLD